MKKMLLALALGLSCGGEQHEEECLEYRTVLEETFSRDDGWEFDEEYSYGDCISYRTDGCYAESLPCKGSLRNSFIFSGVTSRLSKIFSIPPGVVIDRVVLQGNAYGRNVELQLQVEDYSPSSIRILHEKDDCQDLVVASFDDYRYHNITHDGNFYLGLSLRQCDWAPNQPECFYHRRNTCNRNEEREERAYGCYGLSKIMFQQCRE